MNSIYFDITIGVEITILDSVIEVKSQTYNNDKNYQRPINEISKEV